jgi:hypothetical protein
LITFKGEFPDKRPKPHQVVGVGDVLNISIFKVAAGGLFTPGQATLALVPATSSICHPRPLIKASTMAIRKRWHLLP